MIVCQRTIGAVTSANRATDKECSAGASVVGNCGRARRRRTDSTAWIGRRAGLDDPVQRAGAGRSHQQGVPGAPGKLTNEHKEFLARLVEDGPIPAFDGVVRWRACDLIMRLHQEFGISVSDDTVYRSLKDLGFSHVSARPRAYKQNLMQWRSSKKAFPARVDVHLAARTGQ